MGSDPEITPEGPDPLLQPDPAEIDRRRFFLVDFEGGVVKHNPNYRPVGSRRCIVLDLDQTLICTAKDARGFRDGLGIYTDPSLSDLRMRSYYFRTQDPVREVGRGVIYEHYGMRRPYLEDFLNWCFNTFDVVAIWSAGRQKYVEDICEQIFRGEHRPHIVWSLENCKMDYMKGKEEYGLQPTKPLQKMIYSDEGIVLGMSLENTFLLDDRSDVSQENPFSNVKIPIYNPYGDEDDDSTTPKYDIASFRLRDNKDRCLLQFMTWLTDMMVLFRSDPDVRSFLAKFRDEVPWS